MVWSDGLFLCSKSDCHFKYLIYLVKYIVYLVWLVFLINITDIATLEKQEGIAIQFEGEQYSKDWF